jgi:serine/threonine protein phosphatase 1
MNENLFIVGDVHACFHTLQALLKHWNPTSQRLIFVGDLIDRGNFSPETVAFVRKLQINNPDTIVLMGNHEYEAAKQMQEGGNKYWFSNMGKETILQYEKSGFSLANDVKWFRMLPLFWEQENVFVSHAGLSNSKNALEKEDYEYGILWTRKPLKNMDKLQVHGHTPFKEGPIFSKECNSWNVDSACVYGGKLSAGIWDNHNKNFFIISEDVHGVDIQNHL